MPDIFSRDLELRAPADLSTDATSAVVDILVGLTAGTALSMLLHHPPFGERSANPSVWILLPAAIGARHGEVAGLAAGFVAWLMQSGLITAGRLAGPSPATSAFLFMLTGGLAGFLSGALRKIASEELAKHRRVKADIRCANLTLRMAGRHRDDLLLELFRARAGGSAVAPLLRRVLLAPEDRRRDEILEYLESVHEVRSSAVYRHEEGDAWRLVVSRGSHPDGEYPGLLSRGREMAAAVRFSEEPVFAENPLVETRMPLLVAPLVAGPDEVSEVVVVEDVAAERTTPRETLGIATAVEFLGLALWTPRDDVRNGFADKADLLLRLSRGCGLESSVVVFSDSEEGLAACASLRRRLPSAIEGRWEAAADAPALLAPGEHVRRLAPMLAEIRAANPRAVVHAAGFHEACDDMLRADDWIAQILSGDGWII